ncbi:cytochrome P450 [Epithele typhae]|uniref:cytochrome P450 n=1 Tax=Epithele typhae TaxID=378194 RepID=UPI00200842DB|nr:cytochrome P450 [Epithele typhae]KAH9931654.1 cytochrome P450 [Epithele typhae]
MPLSPSPFQAAAVLVAAFVLRAIYRTCLARLPEDNIPGPPADHWFMGHMPSISTRHSWKAWTDWATTYGSAYLIKFPIERPVIVTHDPKAIHHMLIKDMDNFPKFITPSAELPFLLGPGVLTTLGDQHKRQRKLLNPVFSSAHLRDMTHIFYMVAHRLNDAMGKRVPEADPVKGMDVNAWMARTTLEMLGQAGLGYSFDNFSEDSTDEFAESVKLFFPVLMRCNVLQLSTQKMSEYLSTSAMRRLWRMLPLPDTNKLLDISETMERRSREIIAEKKRALEGGDEALAHEIGEGKDIMSICLKANMAATEHEKMSDDEIIAQVSTFILAGMDTTSNALSRILLLLAGHPDVQDKLRKELVEAQGADRSDLSYEDLVKLPYLDAVCRETLRLHAPVPITGRMASTDTAIPLAQPLRARDGRPVHELAVSRGTLVLLNLQASNVDRALWGDDAAAWRPERWLAALPAALEGARVPGVYAHLMTFSAGSTSCIGFKFSQAEMKVILATLLPVFSFALTDKEVTWNASAVLYPTMGYDSDKPEMRLFVKAIKS